MRGRTPLVGFLGAVAVSDLGSKMTFVALPWLVLVTTGSATAVGVVAAAELFPFIAAVALGAPLVDRLGARRVAIATDVSSCALMGTLALTFHSGLSVVTPLVVLLGALRGMGQNAQTVLLRPVTEQTGADLVRTTAIYQGIFRFNELLFAPLAGVLIAVAGIWVTIAVDAVSFAISAAVVSGLVRPQWTKPGRVDSGYVAALWQGVRHLWSDRLLMGMFAMYFVTNLGHQAAIAVFVPLWVHDVLHSPTALGLVAGAYALGALLGSAAFAALATRLPRYPVLVLGFLIGGAPRFVALAYGHDPLLLAGLFLLSGFAVAPVMTITGALLYERVPPDFQARVFGAATAVAMAGTPLGVLLGGWAAAGWGLPAAALLAGAAYLAATLAPVVWSRTWRAMDARPVPASSPA